LQENAGRIANVASCLVGTPMVTQGLQDMNSMLQRLVGAADAPEALLVKIDTRGARAALLAGLSLPGVRFVPYGPYWLVMTAR
jgi:hypothetical protein